MKALLVTTVEREPATTMGAGEETFSRIMVIPWKEISSIDVTAKPDALIHRIEDSTLTVTEFMPVDMGMADSFQAIDDMRSKLNLQAKNLNKAIMYTEKE